MIDRVLEHLRVLIAADTSNPRASMTGSHPLIDYVALSLKRARCAVTVDDLGGGCINVLATRGEPSVLMNCHLDTVPAGDGWTRPPFELSLTDERAFGRGVCDIKGAAACLLTAIEASQGSAAVLFTTDEEAGRGDCVNTFTQHRQFNPGLVVVAEPTDCLAVLQHRGFASFELSFEGSAGHSSGESARSAIHDAITWARAALDLAGPHGPYADWRFNIGKLAGGSASNVVAAVAALRFGFRPPPAASADALVRELKALVPEGSTTTWSDRFIAPPLAATIASRASVEALDVQTGPDVDFWTEAALFAAAELPAIVLGPGNIAQAHAADEYVALDQLDRCAQLYTSILAADIPAPADKEGHALAP